MFERFIRSVDYRFWLIIAFWLGVKLAFALGILLMVALHFFVANSALLIVAMFLPVVLWFWWVFGNTDLFKSRVRCLLRLE